MNSKSYIYWYCKLILAVLLVTAGSSTVAAQLWENALDSAEIARLAKRKLLQADPSVQTKVNDEINQHRLLMLGYEWWGLPTEEEQSRIDFAKRARYEAYDSLVVNNAWRNANGVFYRNQERLSPKQNLIIMGWHPYWEGETYQTYNYSLLTHVAYYGYEVNPLTGGYMNFRAIHNFTDNDLIKTAHLDTCKVLLTVSLVGEESHAMFFTGEKELQQNLIDSLRAILIRSGADGLDLNFEDVPEYFKEDFIDFIEKLSFEVREDNNNYTICLSLPLYDKDNVYEIKHLKPWIDFFVINGFNFHIKPTELEEGPLAPLLTKDAPIRESLFMYERYTNLAELLTSTHNITSVEILHDEEYVKRLLDSLNASIKGVYRKFEYDEYDVTSVLNKIKITQTSNGVPLWLTPRIKSLLKKTQCVAEINKRKAATMQGDKTRFFLFRPKRDTLKIKEFALFNRIQEVHSAVDSQMFDIRKIVSYYKDQIGEEYASSLVLGLPYHGAVWYKNRYHEKSFEGYMPYSEIMRLVGQGIASVDYDKATQSLIATRRDSLGGVYKIYFDNSTSLGKKYQFTIDAKIGGVGLWALGADHAHTELWAELEDNFVTQKVWNEKIGRFDRVKVVKGNKIEFTIGYLLKRYSPLTIATLSFIAIFLCISFCFSILDWKVRDVLFYSGAFRILYLVIFAVVFLVIGNWLGWFKNSMVTFAIGTALGLILTWIASSLVDKQHNKLP